MFRGCLLEKMLSKTTAGLTHGEGVSKYAAYNMQRISHFRWTEIIDTHIDIDDDEERNILRNTKWWDVKENASTLRSLHDYYIIEYAPRLNIKNHNYIHWCLDWRKSGCYEKYFYKSGDSFIYVTKTSKCRYLISNIKAIYI